MELLFLPLQASYSAHCANLAPWRSAKANCLLICITPHCSASLCGCCGLQDAVIIGGVEQQQQAQALARRPHVVVATPGRLAALVTADSSLGAGEAAAAAAS
jgi:hypothetical protein